MGSLYSEVTNSIIAALEQGADTYQMPWHRAGPSGRPHNAISRRGYQGVNSLLLWAAAQRQGHTSNAWATYRQWRAAGAQVRNGESSTVILLYRPLATNDANEVGSERLPVKTVARAFRVFNADQVEGYTAPLIPILPEAERLTTADTFCSRQGATIWFGSDLAFYDPRSDAISIPSFGAFKSARGYYSVLIHELAHWTGAKSRLDRDLSGRFGSEAYAMEELIAELSAAFVTAHLGLGCEPRRDHAPYIASWLRVLRKDSRAIMSAASRAQAAADYLIARAAQKDLGDGPEFVAAQPEVVAA